MRATRITMLAILGVLLLSAAAWAQQVNRVLFGQLIVDVIDAREKKLAFRATASDTVSDNPQKNEKKIHKAVEKMFEKYPGNPAK